MTDFKTFRAGALVSKALAAIVLVASGSAFAQSITMASTTSTEQSGLFGYLLPEFKKASGLDIKVVALGTGQALDMARRGDADVLFVHDQVAEEKFVADGWGVKRYPVMYNDFILIGPKNDPVGTKGKDIVQALQKLSAANGNFISRGDKSGTHAAELRYWKLAGAEAANTSKAAATRNVAAAWGQRSTSRRQAAPMCWPTVAPGSTSRTARTWPFWSRATPSSSTSTA